MAQQSNTTYFPTPIDNGKIPKEGPQAVSIPYDFSAGVQSYTTDMQIIKQQGKISMIQSVYIDNSNNNQPLVLTVSGIGQQVVVPATYQGIFPVLVTGQPVFFVTSAGSGHANIYYCNVQQAAFMWQTAATSFNPITTLPVSDAILDATVSNNRVNTTVYEAPAAITDWSGVIAVGNTAQQLMPANPLRRGWAIQNIDETNIEQLRYNLTGTATGAAVGSFTLGASGGANVPGGYAQGVGTGAISIFAATTGHRFTAIEW